MTTDSKELLALADEYEAGTTKAVSTGYEEYGPSFQRQRKLIVDALRLAATAPQSGMRAEEMREACAKLIESGAGMANLIDQDDLDQQARMVRALPAASPADPKLVAAIKSADAAKPEAQFDNAPEMLNWLDAPPPSDDVRSALEHAEVRFRCLVDHFKEVGEEALQAMSEVDAERMQRGLAGPVVSRPDGGRP